MSAVSGSSITTGERLSSTSLLKQICINLLAFGLELCDSAGFSYIPPLLLKNGFSEWALTLIVGLGSLFSLFLVSFLGRCSDSCTSRFGRRRPFMLALGLIICLSLLTIPFSFEISKLLYNMFSGSTVIALSVIAFDFSTQAAYNPCKALVADMFESGEDEEKSFSVYSCMLSFGGVVGYLISSVDWENTIFHAYGQEKAVFCILAVMFVLLLISNLVLAKEVPLKVNGLLNGISEKETDEVSNVYSDAENQNFCHRCCRSHDIANECEFTLRKFTCKRFKFLYKLICLFSFLVKKIIFEIKVSFVRFFKMPSVLLYLFLSNVFGWMAIACHDVYYTDFIGQVIYRGNPIAEDGSAKLALYNDGVRMGSWGLLFHCLVASICSCFVYERFIKKFGLYHTYGLGLVIFTLCMFGTILTHRIVPANIFCAISGIGYSILTTVPFELLSIYHSDKKKYFGQEEYRGFAEDMAVLDSASYVGQIVPSFFLGFLAHFMGSSATYMIVAAFCGILSIYTGLFIKFPSK